MKTRRLPRSPAAISGRTFFPSHLRVEGRGQAGGGATTPATKWRSMKFLPGLITALSSREHFYWTNGLVCLEQCGWDVLVP